MQLAAFFARPPRRYVVACCRLFGAFFRYECCRCNKQQHVACATMMSNKICSCRSNVECRGCRAPVPKQIHFGLDWVVTTRCPVAGKFQMPVGCKVFFLYVAQESQEYVWFEKQFLKQRIHLWELPRTKKINIK